MTNEQKERLKEIIDSLLNSNMGTTGELNYQEMMWFQETIHSLLDEQPNEERPRVICICGSTRFADLHAVKRWEFERDGKAICLMINYLPQWYAEKEGWGGLDHFGEKVGNKDMLDELHMRKIDMADEVYVINFEGYIGNSTRNEIEYAEKTGRPVKYMEALGLEGKE